MRTLIASLLAPALLWVATTASVPSARACDDLDEVQEFSVPVMPMMLAYGGYGASQQSFAPAFAPAGDYCAGAAAAPQQVIIQRQAAPVYQAPAVIQRTIVQRAPVYHQQAVVQRAPVYRQQAVVGRSFAPAFAAGDAGGMGGGINAGGKIKFKNSQVSTTGPITARRKIKFKNAQVSGF
jgi:hypothetical protein